MQLSTNFTLQELTHSNTAVRAGVDNTPTQTTINNLKALAINVLQPVRDHFKTPLKVTSGYRSDAVNRLVGGALNSQHTTGNAADIDAHVFGGTTNRQLFEYIKNNLVFDQLIAEFGNDGEPSWVHVSFVTHRKNRKQVLKATKNSKGSTVYQKISTGIGLFGLALLLLTFKN